MDSKKQNQPEMIHLETLNKRQLLHFVDSGRFQKYDFLPITKHRAKSQIKNPKAADDDVLLILVFENQKLAGYLGILPDETEIASKKIKFGWLSTLYVSPDFRGKSIAKKMLEKAFEVYYNHIIITEFTPEAASLYSRTGKFKYMSSKSGQRFFFKSDLERIIPSKKVSAKKFSPIFSLVDGAANFIISFLDQESKNPSFHYEILSEIDSESKEFITQFKSNRSFEELNWIINNPWIVEGEKKESTYLFSSVSQQFRYFWIKIFDDHKMLHTCALLLLRDNCLKIPYLFNINKLTQFSDFLSWFVKKNQIYQLTSYHPELNQVLYRKKSFPAVLKKKQERKYMLHKDWAANLPPDFNPEFQDGDGDCAFT